MMVGMEARDLLASPGFGLASGLNPPPNRRVVLSAVRIQPLDEARVQLPPSFGPTFIDGLVCAAPDSVFHSIRSSTDHAKSVMIQTLKI